MPASLETFRSASGAGKRAVCVVVKNPLLMKNTSKKLLNSGARKSPKACSPRMPVLPSSISWRNTAETCCLSLVWFWFLPAQRLWELGPCRFHSKAKQGYDWCYTVCRDDTGRASKQKPAPQKTLRSRIWDSLAGKMATHWHALTVTCFGSLVAFDQL